MDKDSIEAREVPGSDELVLDFLNPTILGSSLFLILTPSPGDDIALLSDYPNKQLPRELFIR